MIDFLRNISNLVRLLFILAKYELLSSPGRVPLSKKLRYFGKFLVIFLYPPGLFYPSRQSFGTRLTKSFKLLGPIYIKFGQTLSTRPDLVGYEVAENLKSLQDKLPPFDSSIVKARIQANFNRDLSEIFSEFDYKPVAAGSIAQVHKAKLVTGEQVAVKILRPNIFKQYNKDILFLEYVASLVTKWLQKVKRLKPKEVIKVFKETMLCELNLRTEAAAASRLYDNFKGDESLCISQIFWQFTSDEIMTSGWVDGISIYDNKKIKQAGLEPSFIAARIAVIFFNQAYRDGFFHADLHPGNVLVCRDGRIALVDFGIIGTLPESDRLAIAEILYGFLKRDYERVAKVHLRAGYIPASTNLELFAQSCRAIAEPIIGLQIRDISIGNLLAQLFRVTEDFGMETQPQLLLLQKTMVVVEGIGQSLDPAINMWQLAEPWIKKWAIKNLTPEAKILRMVKKIINKMLDEHVYTSDK